MYLIFKIKRVTSTYASGCLSKSYSPVFPLYFSHSFRIDFCYTTTTLSRSFIPQVVGTLTRGESIRAP